LTCKKAKFLLSFKIRKNSRIFTFLKFVKCEFSNYAELCFFRGMQLSFSLFLNTVHFYVVCWLRRWEEIVVCMRGRIADKSVWELCSAQELYSRPSVAIAWTLLGAVDGQWQIHYLGCSVAISVQFIASDCVETDKLQDAESPPPSGEHLEKFGW